MLSIQKHILLLNDFHFAEFCTHLRNVKAELSHKLINEIRNFGWEQPESDKLCARVYGSADEKTKKKFLQLTHHTLKLSSYLSRNYPAYLKHNLSLIEERINIGDGQRANLIAEYLCDIAEKIEDFTTHISALKFLSQQGFIIESKDQVKYHRKIGELIENERALNETYLLLREALHFKRKENLQDGAKHINSKSLFDKYIDHPCFSVSILARFGKYYELCFLNNPDFYLDSTLAELEKIERDLNNNSFVVFSFLDDVLFKALGLKLQYMVHKMDSQGMMKESQRIIEESSHLKFWQSYVNIPELFAISIQASHYVSHYGETFREDNFRNLPEDIKRNINYLKGRLEHELDKAIWDDGYIVKLINTRSLYSGLLLLGTKQEIEKAVQLIEETLITYQQIPFQKFLDGMFASMIIGYFSLRQYEKVAECYKRYKKATNGSSVNEENDLTISAYYYTSQWIVSERKQYSEKLQLTYEATIGKNNLHHIRKLIASLALYFHIPMKKDQEMVGAKQ
jgi:hypothetical protein